MIQQGTISFNPTEMLKDLVVVKYSEEGSSHKPAEAAKWIHFVDFLDECAGKATNCCKCTYGPKHNTAWYVGEVVVTAVLIIYFAFCAVHRGSKYLFLGGCPCVLYRG